MIHGSKILVTGGNGFLGSVISQKLRAQGAEVIVPKRVEHDLRDRARARALIAEQRPQIVVHTAWTGGGIGFAQKHPGQMALDNVLMAAHLVDACREYAVSKFVGIGSICSYPKYAAVPFQEDCLWDGYPEETNAAYGIAKRMMLVLTQAYRQEYDLCGIHLLMVNLYGPGDNFDPEHGHVIPGMIRKFLQARDRGEHTVTMWGDGSPTREFIYVEDAGEAVVRAIERYADPAPINVGSGEELSIAALAATIARIVGYDGRIHWDPSKPNGQPRRRLNVERAALAFNFRASTSLEEGLKQTITWYEAQHKLK